MVKEPQAKRLVLMVIIGYVESLNFLILLKEKKTVEEKRQEHKDNGDSLTDEAKKAAKAKAEEEARAKAEEEKRKKRIWEFWK